MSDFKPEFQQSKLEEVILYISERSLASEHFGKSKLHKLLWMSDFHHFGLNSQVLTGATYLRLQHGPICEQLGATMAKLEDTRRLSIRPSERFGYVQQRPVPLTRYDLTDFTAQEIAAIEDVLWETRGMSAHQISEHSHLHPGWNLTEDGEEINYGFAFVPIDEPLEEAPSPPTDSTAS